MYWWGKSFGSARNWPHNFDDDLYKVKNPVLLHGVLLMKKPHGLGAHAPKPPNWPFIPALPSGAFWLFHVMQPTQKIYANCYPSVCRNWFPLWCQFCIEGDNAVPQSVDFWLLSKFQTAPTKLVNQPTTKTCGIVRYGDIRDSAINCIFLKYRHFIWNFYIGRLSWN